MLGEGLPDGVLGEVEGEVANPKGGRGRVPLISEGLGTSLGVGLTLRKKNKAEGKQNERAGGTRSNDTRKTRQTHLSSPVHPNFSSIDNHALLSLSERLLRALVVGELDVADSSRLARLTVHLDPGSDDFSELFKLSGKEGLVDSPREVSDPEGLGRRVSGELGRGLQGLRLLVDGGGSGGVGGGLSLGCEVKQTRNEEGRGSEGVERGEKRGREGRDRRRNALEAAAGAGASSSSSLESSED